MKKVLILLSILIIILVSNKEYNEILIPENAIRIRIIANSSNIEDQMTKLNVKEKIEENLNNVLKDTNSIDNARLNIKKDLNNINNIVKTTINSDDYDINYGYNYFPEKKLHGITYKEGNYESLVIKLGKGEGENWWCVLFPPLCTINVTDNDTNNVQYKSKVLEILNNYK